MSDVTRYDSDVYIDDDVAVGRIVESSRGDLVSYDDYKKLEKERDELLKQNADYDELGLKHLALLKERDDLKEDNDEVRGANEMLRKRLNNAIRMMGNRDRALYKKWEDDFLMGREGE